MPPTPPAPGIVSLDAIWTQDLQPIENTFHYAVGGVIDITALQAIGNVYLTWAAAHLFLWSSSCALTKLYLRDLTTPTSHAVEMNPSSAIVGSITSTPLPNNCAFAVARRTGLAGRKNRGRVYHFGLTVTEEGTENTLSLTVANAIRDGYNALLAAQHDGSEAAEEVIYHRALGTGTPVDTYGYADLVIDSQRRRLPGHNRHH